MTFVIIMPPQVSRSGRNMILSSAANSSLSRSMRHKDIQSSFYYFHLTSMLTDKQRKKRLISDEYSELPDVFQRLGKGEHLKGYIKEVREYENIDVSLTPLRISKGRRCCQDNSGFAQSSRKICSQWTEPIYSLFRCSKKAFKQAIGALYKQKIINIDPEGILLIDKDWSQKRPAVETASLFCGDGEIRTLVQTRN